MANRDVQFIIRARDEASGAFNSLNGALQQLAGWNGKVGESSNVLASDLTKLVSALGDVDKVAGLVSGATEKAGSAYDAQRVKVQQLSKDLQNLEAQRLRSVQAAASVQAAGRATGNTAESTAQVAAIEAAQKQLTNEIGRTSNALGRAKTDLDSLATEYQRAASLANAFDAASGDIKQGQNAAQAAAALQEQSAWLERIRSQMAPAAGIQAQYRAEIEKANAALKSGLMTETEHLAVVKMLEGEQKKQLSQQGLGPTGRPTMLGMTPWQMTNLSYQVNDVVSGLAMGQKPSQIIAQQLGQIIQLFPKLGSGIMAAFSNPYFLAAAATFGTIAYMVKQAADNAQRLRDLAGVLKATADGANYTAGALNENVKALERYNLTAEEAMTMTRQFIKDGLNPEYFTQFGMAAKDMARVMGVDVKSAAEQIGTAFTGGYNALAKFDDETHFLTASEREHIRTLYESGNAADGARLAFEKFQAKVHSGAKDNEGSLDHLGNAWERVKQSMGDSGLANALLKGLDHASDLINSIADAIERVNQADKDYALKQSGGSITVELPAATKATPEQEAAAKAKGGKPGPVTVKTQAEIEAENDTRTEIQMQQALANATTAADKIRIAGEIAYKKAMDESKDSTVAAMKAEQARADVTRELTRAQNSSVLSTAEGYIGRDAARSGDNAVLQSLFKSAGIKAPGGGQLDPQKVAWCAAFVNAVLYGKGVPGTGSLAANSFSKFGTSTANPEQGDIVVIKNKGGGNHVGFFEGFTPGGGVRVLGGNQDASKGKSDVSVETFARSSVQSFRRAPLVDGSKGLEDQIQKQQQLDQAQNQFNTKLDAENESRKLAASYATKELAATVDQTYELERQKAIDEAVKQKKDQAEQQGLTFSPDQQKAVEASVGAAYDQEHAESLVNDRLQEQQQLRDSLLASIQEASAHGDNQMVAALTQQLRDLTPAFDDAITKAEDFWNKAPNGPKKTEALQNLRELRDGIKDVDIQLLKLKDDQASMQVAGATSLRDALKQHIDQSQQLGDKAGARDALAELQQTNDQLSELIQKQIDAKEGWLAMSDAQLEAAGTSRQAIEAEILGLKDSQNQAKLVGRQYLMTGRQINEAFTQDAMGAIQNFQQEVENGTPIITAFWHSIVGGIANFLEQIALAIMEQLIFNAVSGGSGGSGGMGGGIAGFVSALFGKHHNGGIAGSPSQFSAVSPAVFAGAMRYHTGGLAGLKPDEVPAILKRGEEVLTQTDARHRSNLGAGRSTPGQSRGLRQVLAIGDDEIARAMAGSAGEDVFLTHLRRNRSTVKQLLSEP